MTQSAATRTPWSTASVRLARNKLVERGRILRGWEAQISAYQWCCVRSATTTIRHRSLLLYGWAQNRHLLTQAGRRERQRRPWSMMEHRPGCCVST
jgi:hypothetical protein